MADVPDVENDTYTTKLHWMVRNVWASPVKTIVKEENGETVVPYLPPHPYKGMAYHRYPIFVFEQPSKEWEEQQAAHLQQTTKTKSATTKPSNTKSVERTSDTTSTTDGISVSPLLASVAPMSTPALRTFSTSSRPPVYDRDNFNIRAWANLKGLKPVGAHLVRCEWDSHVPGIIASLGLEEKAYKKIRSEETTPFDFPHPGTFKTKTRS
jgi:Phosphatidylethanolamine-binding protein